MPLICVLFPIPLKFQKNEHNIKKFVLDEQSGMAIIPGLDANRDSAIEGQALGSDRFDEQKTPTNMLENSATDLRLQLHQLAERFVESINDESFYTVPYAKGIVVRSPLSAAGSVVPLSGTKEVWERWWVPFIELVEGISLVETYVNADLSAVNIEVHYHIGKPVCTLRAVERLSVAPDLTITEQESFFDARDLADPLWRNP